MLPDLAWLILGLADDGYHNQQVERPEMHWVTLVTTLN